MHWRNMLLLLNHTVRLRKVQLVLHFLSAALVALGLDGLQLLKSKGNLCECFLQM